MMSFFDKLRNSVGIEEEDQDTDSIPEEQEEQEEKEEKSKKKDNKKKEKAEKKKKIAIKVEESDKEEEEEVEVRNEEESEESQEDEAIQEKKEDWFEPEGELAVDVYNTEDTIAIRSTIAGVKPEDLDVSIENDVVTITGERKSEEVVEEKDFFYKECYWGSFSRQIILPEEIDPSKAEASMKDGIFTLRLPKLKRQQARKIRVTG
jgi:HSP20 family protein